MPLPKAAAATEEAATESPKAESSPVAETLGASTLEPETDIADEQPSEGYSVGKPPVVEAPTEEGSSSSSAPNIEAKVSHGGLDVSTLVGGPIGAPSPESPKSAGSGDSPDHRSVDSPPQTKTPGGKDLEASTKSIAAIRVLSRKAAMIDDTIWENAALWRMEDLMIEHKKTDVISYLEQYHMKAESADKWTTISSTAGLNRLSIKLDTHETKALQHNWYLIECELTLDDSKKLEWPAPRRLVQLREFHDHVKSTLGDATYKTIFGSTPFARHGGMPGTTDRLSAWLRSLASDLARVPPSLAALTLQFLEVPRPSTGVKDREDIENMMDSMLETVDYLVTHAK
jgi:hypothetical protein